jgi:DNA primase
LRLTQEQVRKAINLLNISTNHEVKGDWLSILCPAHDDHNYGSASINLESGVTSCFSCHQSVSVIELIKQRYNTNFRGVIELLDGHTEIHTFYDVIQSLKKERKESKILHEFEEISFDPYFYYYTIKRGFTKEFCKQFNVTRCLNGIYNDYMIIPCQDSNKKIFEFEARRLMEYEYLNVFCNTIEGEFNKLKRRFNSHIRKNKIKLKDFLVIQDGQVIQDNTIKYLLQTKIKYPKNSQLYRTIWNIDNLDFNQDLYITEGLGSMPKIWTHISNNCSVVYGSKIDWEQIGTLKKFKKIIVIPDKDNAGYSMIMELNKHLENFVIKDIDSTDTDDYYTTEIKKTREITPDKYLSKYILRRLLWT